MVTHSDVYEFHCQFCSKSFKTKALLQRHVFLHTGQGKFHCSRCQESFIRKELWQKHVSKEVCLAPGYVPKTVKLPAEDVKMEELKVETVYDMSEPVMRTLKDYERLVVEGGRAIIEEAGQLFVLEKSGDEISISLAQEGLIENL